jgi:beta-lactamase class A
MSGSTRRTQRRGIQHWPGLALVLLAVLLLPACAGSGDSASPEAGAVLPPTPTLLPQVTPMITPVPPAPTPTPEPTRAPIIGTTEQELADSLLANEPGVYGFVVLAEDGSVIASHNATTPFITASLYKLVVIADIYRRIEAGELDQFGLVPVEDWAFDEAGDMYFAFDEAGSSFPMQDLLYAVGAFSSNAAARTLLTFTNPEALRETAIAIGMENTYLFSDPRTLPFWPPVPGDDSSEEDVSLAQAYLEESAMVGPVNVTTPLDMARYQYGLMTGTLISPWVSEQIIAILEKQLIRDRIPFVVPADMRVYNKPGNLVDAVHDVGVVYLEDGPRAIATMSMAVPNDDRATLVLQRLAMIAIGETDIPPVPDEVEDSGSAIDG